MGSTIRLTGTLESKPPADDGGLKARQPLAEIDPTARPKIVVRDRYVPPTSTR